MTLSQEVFARMALRLRSSLTPEDPYMLDESERNDLNVRFRREGLDLSLSDDKKLPHVWRWLTDAEANVMSLRNQIDKLYKQQEKDIKEVEEYVEHVWQISSDKIKSLENENDFLAKRLLVLDRIPSSPVTSDGIVNSDSSKEPKHGLMSLFKLKKQVHPVQPFASNTSINDNNNNSNNRTSTGSGCKNCAKVTADNRQIIEDLSGAIHDLEQENQTLSAKLSDMVSIFDRLRREHQQLKQIKSPVTQFQHQITDKNSNRKTSEEKMSRSQQLQEHPHHSRQSSNEASRDKEVLVPHKPSSPQHLLATNNPGDSGTDTGVFSSSSTTDFVNHSSERREYDSHARNAVISKNAPSPSPCSSSSSSKEVEDNRSSSCSRRSICSSSSPDRKRDDVIFGLRKQIIMLKKQVQDKESQYQDLLHKYSLAKEKHKNSIKRMREHIERENKKWQQLFQAANLRKRQALAELESVRMQPLSSSHHLPLNQSRSHS